jgi:N-acetylglucosamine kinase-like BadF-type ATPase
MNWFLGVDGGQSHTTALIADARGRIVGRGAAGPSNHTREPGGRDRLANALRKSVGEALHTSGLSRTGELKEFKFASAHLAMTGESKDKIGIIRENIRADRLVVGHDAPAALAGALAGGEGVVVLAGTGSVACGEAGLKKKGTKTGEIVEKRRFIRVGGHGYLFGDEGSAFGMVREAISFGLVCEDVGRESELKYSLLDHFKRRSLKAIAQDYYAGEISRDKLASFAAKIGKLADRGCEEARWFIDKTAGQLAVIAIMTATYLGPAQKPLKISYSGGMFNCKRFLRIFAYEIEKELPEAEIVAPRFKSDVGALLLAYRDAGKKMTPALLTNIERTITQP